ncbi:MAG: hypothetical protein AAB675_01160 [Patescibacteria group bacterium]
MKFNFLRNKREDKKAGTDHKQELLLKQGREQFKALIKRGLSVPVALL